MSFFRKKFGKKLLNKSPIHILWLLPHLQQQPPSNVSHSPHVSTSAFFTRWIDCHFGKKVHYTHCSMMASLREGALFLFFSTWEWCHSFLAREDRGHPGSDILSKRLPRRRRRMFIFHEKRAEGFDEMMVHVTTRRAGVGSAVVAEEAKSLVGGDHDGFTFTAFQATFAAGHGGEDVEWVHGT